MKIENFIRSSVLIILYSGTETPGKRNGTSRRSWRRRVTDLPMPERFVETREETIVDLTRTNGLGHRFVANNARFTENCTHEPLFFRF
jgi:hypothetical protein